MWVSLLKSRTDITETTWGRFQYVDRDGEQVEILKSYHKCLVGLVL